MFWRQFPATRQLCRVFCRKFRFSTKVTNFKQKDSCTHSFDANFEQQDSCTRYFSASGQLRTVFWTSFSLLTKDAKFKQIHSSAKCIDANFEQQECCARCFGQVLAFQQKWPISNKKTVAQSVLTPISSNRTVAHFVLHKHFNKCRPFRKKLQLCKAFSRQFRATGQLRKGFWTSFSLLTKVTNFKHNDSFAECFDSNFQQQGCCARCLGQPLALKQKGPILNKKTVAQGFLTPISSNRTVAHGVLNKFLLFNKSRQFQEKRKLRRVFWRRFSATGQLRGVFGTRFSFLTKVTNFRQNDSSADCFDTNFEQ